ncbi:MAG: hypothetical protein A2W17_04490 [Planctomycetes bacterium RBG_16_41_13]|nr:MAG: hypothetical protein A2W17_04490 [Planctomycetes bacterium RBG_16_41_13]
MMGQVGSGKQTAPTFPIHDMPFPYAPIQSKYLNNSHHAKAKMSLSSKLDPTLPDFLFANCFQRKNCRYEKTCSTNNDIHNLKKLTPLCKQ